MCISPPRKLLPQRTEQALSGMCVTESAAESKIRMIEMKLNFEIAQITGVA